MLKSFRDSLLTTAMAMTPFLLTACGGDDGTNTNQKFEGSRVQVVSTTAAASAHPNYQALLLDE